jgi:DNA segregation ATPase FtsK/SpoIIIE, S-DNA-T family
LQDKTSSLILGIVLSLLGIFIFFSLLLAVMHFDPTGIFLALLIYPGNFLFLCFHYAAFFLPMYFVLNAWLLVRPVFSSDQSIIVNFLIFPFLTAGVSLRLFFRAYPGESPITVFVVESFTRRGGIVLSALITIILVIIAFQLRIYLKRRRLNLVDEKSTGKSPGRSRPYEIEHFPAPKPSPVISLPGPVDNEEAVDEVSLSQEEEPLVYANNGLLQLERLPEVGELRSLQPYDSGQTEEDDGDEAQDGNDFEDDIPDAILYPDFDEASDEITNDEGSDMLPGEDIPIEESSAVYHGAKGAYSVPVDNLLDVYKDGEYWHIDDETRRLAEALRKTLEEFKIQAEVTGIKKGPVITMFEILPAHGVKLSKIVNLSDNIALRLAASSVRIVAPIPGKQAVGIEIPNRHRSIVSFREMISDEKFNNPKMEIPIALGKDITGEIQVIDLPRTPHLLIAGATGSGKSVCVNSIIGSILYKRSPAEVRLLLIDPKIVELKFYNDIPHLLTPVITDPKKAFQALQYCIYEMERRYTLLDALAVRDIRSYNRKVKEQKLATTRLPYIVIIVDEFADLMATSGKELESTLARLAAMSRAVGIHLVLATQRPSIDVITGLIKANIPSRIAFMVAGKFDSRIIIDMVGAEKLLGAGDMLFTSPWNPYPARMQGAFLSEDEVERVADYVKQFGEPEYIDDEIFIDEEEEGGSLQGELEDPLMQTALQIVIASKKASASYLQRRLKIGYNRAARIVEELERQGIVGPQNGSKPREILIVPEQM